jgi:transcription elongation factor GreA
MADTNNDEQKYLTKEGYENLKKELEELTTVKRRELAEKLQHAISQGDLSENAEYQEAKEEQAFLEGRIRELETVLASATIIAGGRGSTVKIGSTVSLERGSSKKPQSFTIVGVQEADPLAQKISHQSPLGAALLGRRSGETVSVNTPNGVVKWKIKSVK